MRVTTTEIVTLTPQLARQWLASRARQGEPDPLHAAALAEQMRAGLWQLGSVIRFEAGRLIDGAHRCHAVALSGVSIDVVRIDGPT